MQDNSEWRPVREIGKGEELFLDYGQTYWANDIEGNASKVVGDAHGDQTNEDYVGGEEYIEEDVDDEEDDAYVTDEQSDEDERS